MSQGRFERTDEQKLVAEHGGSAFVTACPGAGKTCVLVERAGTLLRSLNRDKGIAFLSFTNAAVSELERRLRQESLLPSPPFPHFIGTFDSFLWQYLVAPFGIPGFDGSPRLIPDMEERLVGPTGWRGLRFECFDPETGEVDAAKARRLHGFDSDADPARTNAYVRAAAAARERFLRRGELDFAGARRIAADRIDRAIEGPRLAKALSARFCEVIVDEAQDCSPDDLRIIQWLRDSGIATKVICDPNQSIYSFRGGVTEELVACAQTFAPKDRLSMSGNFRSSDPICRAIVALRKRSPNDPLDRALGKHASASTPVQVLAYAGRGVTAVIGEKFRELVEAEGVDPRLCPVLASTRDSAARAAGMPEESDTVDLTLRLARAITAFYCAFDTANRKECLEDVHRVVLDLEERIGDKTYHQFIAKEGIAPGDWRPWILQLMRELRYDPASHTNPDGWLARTRTLLAPHLPPGGSSISMRLRRSNGLAAALAAPPASSPSPQTIHSVKGREFPAVCVVLTTTAGAILDYLETGAPVERSEDARKIYVAASRAERLLVIAIPKGQAQRLIARLAGTETPAMLTQI